MLPNGLKEIMDYPIWQQAADKVNAFPLFENYEFVDANEKHLALNFVRVQLAYLIGDQHVNLIDPALVLLTAIKTDPTIVLVIETGNAHAMAELRRLFFLLITHQITAPVIILRSFDVLPDDTLQLYAATDCGGLLIDGLGDGIMLGTDFIAEMEKPKLLKVLSGYNQTAFGILQAARTRMSKTEYISCPSCGRTLFDLQETTAMIRKRTDHLKGIKIGIMGCIVNGPGEMADADYGYVGVGKGKIALYRGQNVIKKAVPAEQAVDQLIELICEDGNWIEPEIEAV
jgi:(E)-4-hydroxy-3-methylbut-2-enyl-diphosphate synthase